MKSFVTSTLILGAAALSTRSANSSSCSFELTASGGESGTIGQLSDGQNRIGGGHATATFTISNGGITDAFGRGCILTPSTEQYQCDQGVGPTYGFAIENNGTLTNAGSSIFYACPSSDYDWNLYKIPVAGQLKCVEISLTASSCYGSSESGAATSSSAEKTVTVTEYACGTSSTAEGASTSPALAETSTVVPVGQTSSPAVVESSSVVEQSTTTLGTSASALSVPTAPVLQSSTTSVVESSSVTVEQSTTPAIATTAAGETYVPTTTISSATPAIEKSSASSAVESSTSVIVSAPVSTTITSSATPATEKSSASSAVEESSTFVVVSASVGGSTIPAASEVTTSSASTSYISVVESTTLAESASTVRISSYNIITSQTTATSVPSQTWVASSSVIPSTTLLTITKSSIVATVSSASSVYIQSSSVVAPYTNTSTSIISSATASSTIASTTTSSVSSDSCVATTLVNNYIGADTATQNYQYPHLIVPISSTSPDVAYGTSYFGNVSSTISTIFNFDIPSTYSGSICNLIFLLPLQSELETSSYTFSGTGGVDFHELSTAASISTTWDTAPTVSSDLGEFTLTEGSSTLVKSFSCSAGETVSYEMSGVGSTDLYYFQDWNPSPLGLFITYC